jgi:hypothetical protein
MKEYRYEIMKDIQDIDRLCLPLFQTFFFGNPQDPGDFVLTERFFFN